LSEGKRKEFYKAKDQRFLGSEEFGKEVQDSWGREGLLSIGFRFGKSWQRLFLVWEYRRNRSTVKNGIGRDLWGGIRWPSARA
jgi:hypothetical protein